MIIISPTELRASQKKYFDLAEKEQVIVKRGGTLIELVVKQRTITDADLSANEVKKQVHEHIDKLFDE